MPNRQIGRPWAPMGRSFSGWVAVAAALLALLCGCAPAAPPPDFADTLRIIGDVTQVVTAASYTGYQTHTVQEEGETLSAVYLDELIQAAAPTPEAYTLLLVGSDGLVSEIDGSDLTGCHLTYSQKNRWELINELHPISSRIKLLKEIVVVNTGEQEGAGFADADQTNFLTPGQLYKQGITTTLHKEGESNINDRWVKVYTTRRGLPLGELMPLNSRTAVFARNGQVLYDRPGATATVLLADNRLDYLGENGEITRDLAGVLANPPTLSITEVFTDVLGGLEAGERVLVLELDGWGWQLQQYAEAQNAAPYLASLQKQQALAAYPPVSTVGLAAMLTGETGAVNGITSRDTRELQCEDIFARAAAMGKRSAYLEGSINLLKTSQRATLSVDSEGGDSGVFAKTKQAIADGNDFIFAHFHSIDDLATTHGPYADATMAQLTQVDDMVRQLVEGFDGRVIITADHGLHQTATGGSHGVVCAEDMLVPYITLHQG